MRRPGPRRCLPAVERVPAALGGQQGARGGGGRARRLLLHLWTPRRSRPLLSLSLSRRGGGRLASRDTSGTLPGHFRDASRLSPPSPPSPPRRRRSGLLICCDACSAVFHLACVGSPAPARPPSLPAAPSRLPAVNRPRRSAGRGLEVRPPAGTGQGLPPKASRPTPRPAPRCQVLRVQARPSSRLRASRLRRAGPRPPARCLSACWLPAR